MYRALIVKELRELAGISAIAFAISVALAGKMTRSGFFDWLPGVASPMRLPFVGGEFLESFLLFAISLAMALGFRQSVGESVQGTYPFLLHRPISRGRLMLVKVGTGLAVYFAVSAVPILLYAWWAATPGTHPSPFEWWMTLPTWSAWIRLSLLYLGAFLSGLLPGRWYGTRLLPLAAAWCVYQWSGALSEGLVLLAVLAVAGAWLTANIVFVARTRDY